MKIFTALIRVNLDSDYMPALRYTRIHGTAQKRIKMTTIF